MKILLSAYACHPTIGSEARLGWQWAQQLAARGHQVWVLTRETSRSDIETFLGAVECPDNLHFLYHECPRLLPVLKLLKARFRYFYYYVWQWGAHKLARRCHARESFDLVHHVTWVQYRAPSFMGRLGIPFVFGPVAGGESTPWRLRLVSGLRQALVDLLRDAWSVIARIDPMVLRTYRDAMRINVTSPDTLRRLPAWAAPKAHVQLAIAYEPPSTPPKVEQPAQQGLRLLFVGRFLGLKGMSMGLNALARVLKDNPGAALTMVGDGPERDAWRSQAERLGIGARVTWIDWIAHDDVQALYASHDVLLFPSLHDSGGLVVLEAMAQGMPVVCLDLGGPGIMVDATCGIKVAVAQCSRRMVEAALAEALLRLMTEPGLLARLGVGARRRTSQFDWNSLIAGTYGPIADLKSTQPLVACKAES